MRETESAQAAPRHSRPALWLFLIYVLCYAGFVYLAAFRREVMAREVFTGVNLAVVYGMGLIGGAFVIALVYTLVSGGGDRKTPGAGDGAVPDVNAAGDAGVEA